MKNELVNYVEYKHSYAHALAPKLKSLNYATNVTKKPVNYVRKIVLNAINDANVIWTDKEREFYDSILMKETAHDIYYYARAAVNRAKDILVKVDENGELI